MLICMWGRLWWVSSVCAISFWGHFLCLKERLSRWWIHFHLLWSFTFRNDADVVAVRNGCSFTGWTGASLHSVSFWSLGDETIKTNTQWSIQRLSSWVTNHSKPWPNFFIHPDYPCQKIPMLNFHFCMKINKLQTRTISWQEFSGLLVLHPKVLRMTKSLPKKWKSKLKLNILLLDRPTYKN